MNYTIIIMRLLLFVLSIIMRFPLLGTGATE